MSTSGEQRPTTAGRPAVVAGRLWAGGAATACVAALVAAVGVFVFELVLGFDLVRLPLLLPITDSLALNYAATAFVCALVATGLAHLLWISTPRPRVFFGWIVGLLTIATVILPFAFDASLAAKISTAVINLAIGIAIGTLLPAVVSRTVAGAERSR
jgi:Family of unknown function (DUF6069)